MARAVRARTVAKVVRVIVRAKAVARVMTRAI